MPTDDSAEELRTLLERAANWIRRGQYAKAIVDLQRVLDTRPADPVALSLLGMARFRSRDYPGAEQAYRLLVDQDPNDADMQYALALSLVRLGRDEEAVKALKVALRIRPDFARAATRLRDLQDSGGGAGDRAGSAPPLAQLLESQLGPRPSDTELAGRVRWQVRPYPLAVVTGALLGVFVLVTPRILQSLTEALPNGGVRDVAATSWRLASAVAWPLAGVLVVVGVVSWLMTRYTVRDHRLEILRGVLTRRHIVLWFHDVERLPVVQQNLLEQLLGLAQVVLVTDAVLLSVAARRSRLGRISLRGLSIDQAHTLASQVRESTLVERRRMIANFVSTR